MTLSRLRRKTRSKAADEDERQVLVRAILKLPRDLRDVFLLHRMAGMSYSEIGLHLGMTPKAVETSLVAALVRLTQAVTASDASSNNRTTKLTCIVAKPGQTQNLPRLREASSTCEPAPK